MADVHRERHDKASYRRGTIMGLTAAEAFMLICFVILLLLLLWKVTSDETLERERAFGSQFTQTQKELALIHKDRIHEFDLILPIVEAGATPEQLERALELERRFGTLDPDLMDDRLRLTEEAKLRSLTEAAQTLPEEELLELTDLISTGRLRQQLEELAAYRQTGASVENLAALRKIVEADATPEQLERALELERRFGTLDPDLMDDRLRLTEEAILRNLTEAAKTLPEEELLELTDLVSTGQLRQQLEKLEAYRRTGASVEDVIALREKAQLIEDTRRGLERSGADVARQLREKAGDRIAALGGEILDGGDVIFPENVLFEAGYAEIKPRFDDLLREFCRPWFEVLFKENLFIETVQIEGHASSEYGGLPPRRAFDANLDLSQRRAASVFRKCLDYGGDDEVAEWARTKLAAVGFSSARPILVDGVEHREKSRRVVFAIDMKSEDEALSDAASNEARKAESRRPGAPDSAPVQGQEYYNAKGYALLEGDHVVVRDGDTIEVDGIPIRLQGLHVPEVDTRLGREARNFLQAYTRDTALSCWLSDKTTYDRQVAVCFAGDVDIAKVIIEAGFGADCAALSGGRYASLPTNPVFVPALLPGYCLEN